MRYFDNKRDTYLGRISVEVVCDGHKAFWLSVSLWRELGSIVGVLTGFDSSASDATILPLVSFQPPSSSQGVS